jgi:phage terminase Nu1 subunit (DNA packaging protein)
MSNTVGMQKLATHFTKSFPTIKNWIAKGMPVAVDADRENGIAWAFDLQDCVDWHDDYQRQREEAVEKKKNEKLEDGEHADIIAARKRKIEVETERLLLRLDAERGELVPIDAIARIVGRQYSSVKAHLLSLPDKISPSLVDMHDTKDVNDLLKSYIIEALEELQEEVVYAVDEDDEDQKYEYQKG